MFPLPKYYIELTPRFMLLIVNFTLIRMSVHENGGAFGKKCIMYIDFLPFISALCLYVLALIKFSSMLMPIIDCHLSRDNKIFSIHITPTKWNQFRVFGNQTIPIIYVCVLKPFEFRLITIDKVASANIFLTELESRTFFHISLHTRNKWSGSICQMFYKFKLRCSDGAVESKTIQSSYKKQYNTQQF